MTADGWIPTGGSRPDLPKDALVHVRQEDGWDSSITGLDALTVDGWTWEFVSHYRLAQPAAQEPECQHDFTNGRWFCRLCKCPAEDIMDRDAWHPTSQLPEEGRVVELRFTWGKIPMLMFGYVSAGRWYATDEQSIEGGVLQSAHFDREWRYPAAGPSDADQRGAAGGTVSNGQMPEEAQRQSAPHPYRSRNGYGLRIREADVQPREPLLISYDVFRRMK